MDFIDFNTEEILRKINNHLRIKKWMTGLSYFLIVSGVLVYVFYAFSHSNNIKLIKQYRDNKDNYIMEKEMINPRIRLERDDHQIYDIQAKKAFHKDEQEINLYDVFATGQAGNITAGELRIYEEGDHLVFTKNPIMILHDKKKEDKSNKSKVKTEAPAEYSPGLNVN